MRLFISAFQTAVVLYISGWTTGFEELEIPEIRQEGAPIFSQKQILRDAGVPEPIDIDLKEIKDLQEHTKLLDDLTKRQGNPDVSYIPDSVRNEIPQIPEQIEEIQDELKRQRELEHMDKELGDLKNLDPPIWTPEEKPSGRVKASPWDDSEIEVPHSHSHDSLDSQNADPTPLVMTKQEPFHPLAQDRKGIWGPWTKCRPARPGVCGHGLRYRFYKNGCSSIPKVQKTQCIVPCPTQTLGQVSSAVTFYMYTKLGQPPKKYNVSSARQVPPQYLKGTVRIFIHGWKGSASASYAQSMAQELLKQGGSTAVFLVDWASLARSPIFFPACYHTEKVGQIVASFVKVLESRGASRSRLHLIGFSLGGKVVAAAGANIQNPRIARVTGLDSPTHCIILSCGANLHPDNADFVDAVHTSIVSGGNLEGVADFFPNGERKCSTIFEDPIKVLEHVSLQHHLAVYYFIDSINNQCPYTALPCGSWKDYPNHCDKEAANRMGFHAVKPKSTHKSYYLRANKKKPYCIKSGLNTLLFGDDRL